MPITSFTFALLLRASGGGHDTTGVYALAPPPVGRREPTDAPGGLLARALLRRPRCDSLQALVKREELGAV
jgi:hypothetical protein